MKFCDRYVRLEANIIDNEASEFHLITINDGELIPEASKRKFSNLLYRLMKCRKRIFPERE